MDKITKFEKIILEYLPTLIKVRSKSLFPSLIPDSFFKKKSASLNITDRCNLRCIMCKQWQKTNQNELSTEAWKDVILQLKELGIKEINFTGGEPLLRNDIFEIIKHASSKGIVCGLTTNGTLLTEKSIESLIDNGLRIFTLSIDAIGEDYEKIRGVKDVFKNVEKTAEMLSRIKKERNISVNISFVLMKTTLNHLTDIIKFCKKLNLSLVICLLDKTPYLFNLETQRNLWIDKEKYSELDSIQRLLFEEKKNNGSLIYNSFADFDFFMDYFKDPVQRKIPCVVSQTRIMIDPLGNVYGGCWSMGKIGNVKKDKLSRIVHSDFYRKQHDKMFLKDCPGCSCGYSINLRYSLMRQLKSQIKRLLINEK